MRLNAIALRNKQTHTYEQLFVLRGQGRVERIALNLNYSKKHTNTYNTAFVLRGPGRLEWMFYDQQK